MSDTTTTPVSVEIVATAPVDLPNYTAYTSVSDLFENEPEVVEAVREYYARKRLDYIKRTTEIELFLGFLESEVELGTRLHNLERFVGIKPA